MPVPSAESDPGAACRAAFAKCGCRMVSRRLRLCLLQCRKVPQIERNWASHGPATPKTQTAQARLICAPLATTRKRTAMNVRQLSISRRSVTIAAVLVGMVSLAIGAHAALNKRALDAAKAIATEQNGSAANGASRLALVIGNGRYPDASAPLAQPINDARALTASLRHDGFDVDVVEDASKDDMSRAIGRLKAKIRPDSVVMLFFGGYGIQAGRESYMIPVDAAIWKESDVRRNGISI